MSDPDLASGPDNAVPASNQDQLVEDADRSGSDEPLSLSVQVLVGRRYSCVVEKFDHRFLPSLNRRNGCRRSAEAESTVGTLQAELAELRVENRKAIEAWVERASRAEARLEELAKGPCEQRS